MIKRLDITLITMMKVRYQLTFFPRFSMVVSRSATLSLKTLERLS